MAVYDAPKQKVIVAQCNGSKLQLDNKQQDDNCFTVTVADIQCVSRDLLIAFESVRVAEAHLGDLGLALEVDDEVTRRFPSVWNRIVPRGHPVLGPGIGQGVRGWEVAVVPNRGGLILYEAKEL